MLTKLKIIIFIVIFPIISIAQENCFYTDLITGLVYNIVDSTVYSGICSREYKNGQIKNCCEFKDGIIKISKRWNKKGVLIDSTIHLEGYDRLKTYEYYKTGELKQVSTSYLSGDTLLGMAIRNFEGVTTWYRKNGKKDMEITQNRGENRQLTSYYYKNGNLKSTGYYYSEDSVSKIVQSYAPDSVHTNYFKNGSLKSKTNYTKGKNDGLFIYFNKDGTIKEEKEYKNGVLIN